MGFRADIRAACVTMLTNYAASTTPAIKLQVYPGRPRTLYPPTAFVDRISETTVDRGINSRTRTPSVTVVVVHGLFDSKDAVDQGDAFVDGFLDWILANPHAAGANTLVGNVSTDDDPNYVPDWVPLPEQKSYYATLVTVEGFEGI